MRLLNWNILSGGGNRVGLILSRILEHSPDVCVLTEFRIGKSGDELVKGLHEMGFEYQAGANAEPSKNTAMVFSRLPLGTSFLNCELPEAIKRHVAVTQINGILLIGAFCATPTIGEEFIKFLCPLPKEFPGQSILVAGDLYFGARPSDPGNYRKLAMLEASGWQNVWEHQKQDQEPVWSFQSGKGKSRPDHFFRCGPIIEIPANTEYSAVELEQRISDHAPMLMSF